MMHPRIPIRNVLEDAWLKGLVVLCGRHDDWRINRFGRTHSRPVQAHDLGLLLGRGVCRHLIASQLGPPSAAEYSAAATATHPSVCPVGAGSCWRVGGSLLHSPLGPLDLRGWGVFRPRLPPPRRPGPSRIGQSPCAAAIISSEYRLSGQVTVERKDAPFIGATPAGIT